MHTFWRARETFVKQPTGYITSTAQTATASQRRRRKVMITMKTSTLPVTAPWQGNPLVTGGFPHKDPAIRNAFQYRDVIMEPYTDPLIFPPFFIPAVAIVTVAGGVNIDWWRISTQANVTSPRTRHRVITRWELLRTFFFTENRELLWCQLYCHWRYQCWLSIDQWMLYWVSWKVARYIHIIKQTCYMQNTDIFTEITFYIKIMWQFVAIWLDFWASMVLYIADICHKIFETPFNMDQF